MDSYFTDSSMLRRVNREWAVAFSGPRALLMQATHPVAFEGFFAHTGAMDAPYERLQRTAMVMDTIAFGSREDADRATRRVRAMHKKVRGELTKPAGRSSSPRTRLCIARTRRVARSASSREPNAIVSMTFAVRARRS